MVLDDSGDDVTLSPVSGEDSTLPSEASIRSNGEFQGRVYQLAIAGALFIASF